MDYTSYGYIRTAAAAPIVHIADPRQNALEIIALINEFERAGVSIAVFPELALTGYSCEDLFFSSDLQTAVRPALKQIADACDGIIGVVGTPWLTADARRLNCAAVLYRGQVLGLVPKQALPNYGEFYERRWFVSGMGVDLKVSDPLLGDFRIKPEQLFSCAGATFAIEICEDLWAPDPPGNQHALAGADLLLNLSASTELISKADYRRELVRMLSGQRICAYLYAAAGPEESTKDVVFGGHLIAAENGQVLTESKRFARSSTLLTDFDLDKISHDRQQNNTFANAPRPGGYACVDSGHMSVAISQLNRSYPAHPFVPDDEQVFDARAAEILAIQTTGLARRCRGAGIEHLVIGLSGGLDSTLAFLVCLDTLAQLDLPKGHLHALTMPGPGTTDHTLRSARMLGTCASVDVREIPIFEAVQQHLKDLNHSKDDDVVFENAQARERTQLLFNHANKVGGLVVGTGDLSELALGWCTFNADHMANYNVNASVPKTMMAYLVRWYAKYRADPALSQVLERVLQTPISPELLAPREGQISQHTESIIGPYELHDFFLFHYLRNGFAAEKIFHLARNSFTGYGEDEIRKWLAVFFRRFFAAQFKRTTLPPGPKVGSVSLSPRGDWRMPDEASAALIISQIEGLGRG
ncbi:MAG: NAD(+) synthase [Proteobacteria bacterium]|nr:NAD(+) synthase [Pseudomonadota bacterium]